MAKNTRTLIGTESNAHTMSVAAGTADVLGNKIEADFPPGAENVASAFIHNDGTGGAVVITVKWQMYSGADWGILRNAKTSAGSNITFTANVDTDIEINLYAQDEWKLNNGFRIVLSRASSTLLAGTATAIVR